MVLHSPYWQVYNVILCRSPNNCSPYGHSYTLRIKSKSTGNLYYADSERGNFSLDMKSLDLHFIENESYWKRQKTSPQKSKTLTKKKSIELLSVSTHTGNLASVTRRLRGRGRLQVSFRDFHSSTLPATSKFPDQASVYTINVQWIKWNQYNPSAWYLFCWPNNMWRLVTCYRSIRQNEIFCIL